MRSKLAPEKRHVPAFWDTCNEAGVQLASTARYALSLALMRLNSSPVKIMAKWSPFLALMLGLFQSAKPSANSKQSNRTVAWPAPLGRLESAWEIKLSPRTKYRRGINFVTCLM